MVIQEVEWVRPRMTRPVNGMTLSFFSTISQFGSTEDIALADVKIEQMFPADEATRQALLGMIER